MDSPSIDEDARRRFEAAWINGQPLPLDEYLPAPSDPRWLATLEELVAIELELGWKAKPANGPLLETYFERFPALQQTAIARRLVRQEFAVRQAVGDRPLRASYQARFPELAADWDLRSFTLDPTAPPDNPTPAGSETTIVPDAREHPRRAGGHVLLETIDGSGDSRGRYALTQLHAEGGLGRVWIARDPLLNRDVALKELKPSPARHPEAFQRFLQEAQVTGQLEHPNIVPVYEFGREDAGSKPFYTMRFVRGQTLRHVAAEFHRRRAAGADEPLERRRLLQAFVSICNAISFAHSRGVIHRDLKPENVILGSFGEVLVLDWGLAKATGQPDPAAPAVQITDSAEAQATLSGHIIGTPAYMAPEQAEGNIVQIDRRTDVYGLGAVLFEILTGRAPHVGGGSATLLKRIIRDPTPRVRDNAPTAPRALDAVCARSMAKDPAERYASAADLSRDVERFLADEPVSVYREPAAVRAGRFVRKHQTAVAVATAALLFVAIGSIIGLFLWVSARDKRRAELLTLQTGIEAGESLAMNELKQGHFPVAANLLHRLNDRAAAENSLPFTLRERLAAESDRAGRVADFYRLADLGERNEFFEYDDLAYLQCFAALERLGVFAVERWWDNLPGGDLTPLQRDQLREDAFRELLLLAGLDAKQGLMYFGNAQASSAYRTALATIEISRRLRPTQSAQLLEVFCRLGMGDLLKLRPQKTVEPTCPADEYFIGLMHFWVGAAQADPVAVALKMVQPFTGVDFSDSLTKSDRLLRLAIAAEPRQYWNYFMLGWTKMSQEDYAGAELLFDTCVAVRGDNGLGYAYRGWAILKQALQLDESPARNDLIQRGLDDLIRGRTIEPVNPELAWLHAQALTYINRPDDALAAYQRAVELEPPLETWNGRRVQVDKQTYLQIMLKFSQQATEQYPRNPEAWTTRALAAWMLGQADEAQQAADHALQLRPGDPRALAVRGEWARGRKQFAAALADFAAALKTNPKLWVAAFGRAAVHSAQSLWAQALDDGDSLLGIAETDWQRIAAHQVRGRALLELHRTREAIAAFQAASSVDTHAAEAP